MPSPPGPPLVSVALVVGLSVTTAPRRRSVPTEERTKRRLQPWRGPQQLHQPNQSGGGEAQVHNCGGGTASLTLLQHPPPTYSCFISLHCTDNPARHCTPHYLLAKGNFNLKFLFNLNFILKTGLQIHKVVDQF